MPIDQRLREQAETFADELDRLLRGTLPNTPDIDYQPGWQSVLDETRDSWLRIQTAAVARDFPDTAAEALRELGYEVTPPPRPAHSSPDAPPRSPSN